MNTIHAKIRGKQGNLMTIEIPTDDEIRKIAERMHHDRTDCSENILGWKATYRPSRIFAPAPISAAPLPFTNDTAETSKANLRRIPSVFIIGCGAPWKITLTWQDGDERPPTWSRDEASLICKEPQGTPHQPTADEQRGGS